MARSSPSPVKKEGIDTLVRICPGWGLRVWRWQAGLGIVRKEARWWPCLRLGGAEAQEQVLGTLRSSQPKWPRLLAGVPGRWVMTGVL